MRLAWTPVAGAVALSLGAIAALLGAAATATVRRPGGIIRLLAESTGVGLVPVPVPVPAPAPASPPPAACPPINYREPDCDPARLRPPRPDATDAEVLEDMYHGLKCLEKAIVDPWAASASAWGGVPAAERRQLEGGSGGGGGRHFRCGGEGVENGVNAMVPPPPLPPSNNGSREAGWRAAAERQLCAMAGSMYDAMIACRHSLRRGMHVHSSGELLWRLSTERRCPAGLRVCAVVKNEAAYIQEWLAFHLHSGVQHFHLFLNEDEEDTRPALEPFIDAGFVTAETIEGGGVQTQAYDRCFRKVKEGKLAEWVAFFDVDEFLFLGDHGCLMDYLHRLDDRGGLTVNWRTYSPSNHILPVPPDRLLIESNVYTRADDAALGLDIHVKSVVRVNRTRACGHPHLCLYEDGWGAKDEWGNAIEGPFNPHFPPGQREVHMHHYQMRSHTDFLMKRLRGRAGVADYEWDFGSISHYMGVGARMGSVRKDIQPAVAPVRRLLGLE